MTAAEIRALSEEEIVQHLADLQDELSNLLIQKATQQLSNPNRIRQVKREIARTKTVLHEMKLGLTKTKKS
jgi:large subunit ribosomal protein L29